MIARFVQSFIRIKQEISKNKIFLVLLDKELNKNMKKLFGILAVLAIISPVFADDEPAAPAHVTGDAVNADPGATNANGPTAANNPKYSTVADIAADATSAASAKYVKGAYNATIKAVNMVADQKQNNLNSGNGGNVTESGNGPVVTGISASNGAVTVAKGEITIPTSEPSGSAPANRSSIWLE